mgnify:CR=1 FL=1
MSCCVTQVLDPRPRSLGLQRVCQLQQRPLVAVKGCRKVTKKDMVHNNYMPKIEVDPETYVVRADGQLLSCEPAKELAMAQRYFLF